MNLESLRSRVKNIDEILSVITPKEIRSNINEFFKLREQFYHQSSKLRQIRKFEKMLKHASSSKVKQTRDKSNTVDINKVLVNLSDRILNSHEISLLKKGLNFNINRPQLSPFNIIPAIEPALNILPNETANELRNKLMSALLRQKSQKSNMTKNELHALKQLRNDKTIIITKADKGNTTVIMNKIDYEKKAKEHLQEGPYELIKDAKSRTTLNKLKAETSKILHSLKVKLGTPLWFLLNPKSCNPCRFYGLPKIHKDSIPLRPVVDFTNSPTYNLAKYLARILKPYEKLINHGIKNSMEFKNIIDTIDIEEDEVMASFDVSSLFTNVPINRALDIIYACLESDLDLNLRCPLDPSEFIKCLELCLRSTLFIFRGDLYRQKEGIAMGSPVSPIVANLFMHSLETSAIARSVFPPKVWLRYVDDIFVIIKQDYLEELFANVNNISEQINLTKEIESVDHKLAFLDCMVERRLNNRKLKINVFRKSTHSERYLDFDSAHALCTKVTVVKNLINRSLKLVTDKEDQQYELNRILSTLRDNNYPKEFLKKIVRKERKAKLQCVQKDWKSTVVIPYRSETSEEIKRILNKHDIRVYFRTCDTIRSSLVKVKDRLPKEEQQNIVYEINCQDCNAAYVGETSRQLKVRLKEHKQCLKNVPKTSVDLRKLENKSAIALHALETGHMINFEGAKILQKD
ncbi:unnamed protein product [Schistosoma rodhaini]|nr:unnamed protein product [Schistosoma rodhaini]